MAIPTWNEQESIVEVIEKIRQCRSSADVLVVDDGSTYLTRERALTASAAVVSVAFNVGVGGAIRMAFLFAQPVDFNALVQVDAVEQHDPADADRVLVRLADADIVMGTGFHPKSMCCFTLGTLFLVFPFWILLGKWSWRASWRRWACLIVFLPALKFVTIRFSLNQRIS